MYKIQLRIYLWCIAMCLPVLTFPQADTTLSLLNQTIKDKGRQYKQQPDFYKAHTFFLAKEWDSVMVYSMRQLEKRNSSEVEDYSRYFRATGFARKGLLDEALKEYAAISQQFDFYYKVRLSIGEILLEQNKFKLAIPYFKEIEALEDTPALGFKVSSVVHNLGLCYLHLGRFKEAEQCLFKGFKMQEKSKDTLALIGSYMDIATLYYEQYQDDKAIPNFIKAYELSKKVNDFALKQNAALNMAVVEENKENFTTALNYRKEYEAWRDSLNNRNKVWELAELEKKFAVSQKQKEVNQLISENKVKKAERDRLVYTSGILLVLIAVLIYFYRQKIKINRIIEAQKAKLNDLNAAKDRLFSIVSHDLRSSVSALKSSNAYLLQHYEKKEYEALDKQLHNSSEIANSTYNLLDNLLNWALLQTKQAYFNMEALRLLPLLEQVAYNYTAIMHAKDIHFTIDVPARAVVFADRDSLKLVLRNLLDNAIKYTAGGGLIKIDAAVNEDNKVQLRITDTGIGMSAEVIEEVLKESDVLINKKNGTGAGLGLQLCKSILLKNKGALAIESEPGKGTAMIITLQMPHKNG
ncbi:tetratricopeptide repeat-containing sensor histidine kinase [Flavobacterium coralii]|uniref:tetratricopeptide repeat-containing sensor histidine kinase n=1 Tax=Flavobacterium coralii TaxID=2838017 RepID=UPI000C476C46|nr:histidine kinase [Flavobacterium sp.]